MNDVIYVMLIDGRPYRKEGAIRTYKTCERAEKEARKLSGYWSYRDSKFAVGVFVTEQLSEVTVESRKEPLIPCVPTTEGVNAE